LYPHPILSPSYFIPLDLGSAEVPPEDILGGY
jgi:hypothetical protein